MLKLPDNIRLRKVLGAASRWAERFGSSHLGTDHVLLALVEAEGPASQVLTSAGMSVDALRDAVLASLPESQRKLFAPTAEEALEDLGLDLDALRKGLAEEFGARLPLGPGLNVTTALTATFWLSEQQAERLGSSEVTPEHLLLALLWQGRHFAGASALASSVSISEIRRRLLDLMEFPADVRVRYLEECERSEAIAAEREAASSRAAEWIDPARTGAAAAELLADGGQAAVRGSRALDRLLRMATASGFSVIDAADPQARTFWVEVNTRMRQIFVATASPGQADEIKSVGVTDPRLVPAWVDVRSWPGFPVEQRDSH
jgi:hypothetical protein